jgi:hypothetical protein
LISAAMTTSPSTRPRPNVNKVILVWRIRHSVQTGPAQLSTCEAPGSRHSPDRVFANFERLSLKHLEPASKVPVVNHRPQRAAFESDTSH